MKLFKIQGTYIVLNNVKKILKRESSITHWYDNQEETIFYSVVIDDIYYNFKSKKLRDESFNKLIKELEEL